jgi:hypothetical protein
VVIVSEAQKDRFREVLRFRHGYILAKDVERYGISYQAFFSLVKEFSLEKATPGIYVQSSVIPDSLYLFFLRHPHAVYSHSTALYLLGFSDRDPLIKEITVAKGQNPKTYAKEGGKAHFVEKKLLDLGVVSAATPQGNRVPCYSLERTLVDLVRSRNKGDPDLAPAALKKYVKLKERKIPLLLEYAKAFRVEKIINSYLEVLV